MSGLTRGDICRLWQEEVERSGWRTGGPVEAFVARLLKELDDRPAPQGATAPIRRACTCADSRFVENDGHCKACLGWRAVK